LSQYDDHDLTPYLMENSDDEMDWIVYINDSDTQVNGKDINTKCISKEQRLGKRKQFSNMNVKDLELEVENKQLKIQTLEADKEKLQYEFDAQIKKIQELEDHIENMKDDKPSIIKKCNDINIYGGRCTMQVGDSSLLQTGGHDRIDGLDVRLNRIEVKAKLQNSTFFRGNLISSHAISRRNYFNIEKTPTHPLQNERNILRH